MPGKSTNIGKPIRTPRLVRGGHTETLGDLNPEMRGEGTQEYHDLVRDVRDGASEQRCGGGVRIIRKKTPE